MMHIKELGDLISKWLTLLMSDKASQEFYRSP